MRLPPLRKEGPGQVQALEGECRERAVPSEEYQIWRIDIVEDDLTRRNACLFEFCQNDATLLAAGEDSSPVQAPGHEQPDIGFQLLRREAAAVLVEMAYVRRFRSLAVAADHGSTPGAAHPPS